MSLITGLLGCFVFLREWSCSDTHACPQRVEDLNSQLQGAQQVRDPCPYFSRFVSLFVAVELQNARSVHALT